MMVKMRRVPSLHHVIWKKKNRQGGDKNKENGTCGSYNHGDCVLQEWQLLLHDGVMTVSFVVMEECNKR